MPTWKQILTGLVEYFDLWKKLHDPDINPNYMVAWTTTLVMIDIVILSLLIPKKVEPTNFELYPKFNQKHT